MDNILTEFSQLQTEEKKLPDINYSTVNLKDVPLFDVEDYDLSDEKDFRKYIFAIENIVRGSYEYSGRLIPFLRDDMGMSECSVFKNISNKTHRKVRIELHHSPFTLYDIVCTVIEKRKFNQESMKVEMVAKEVTYLHYCLMVGLIPLSETVHELVHNQVLFIPMNKVLGNYQEFINTYKDFIPEDAMDRYDRAKMHTLVYNNEKNMEKLQQSPLLINGDYTYGLPILESVENMMGNRIEEIRHPQIDQKRAFYYK